jgi:hypothetical protein
MPVISFASSKGGAGKTTSAIVLATEPAEGTDVAAIADMREILMDRFEVRRGTAAARPRLVPHCCDAGTASPLRPRRGPRMSRGEEKSRCPR